MAHPPTTDPIRKTGYAELREPSEPDLDRAADLFKVLSHPDRLRLACYMGDGRVTTQRDLMETFGWPQSTTARHLTTLRRAGLVEGERQGAEVHLQLAADVGLRLMATVCAWVHGEEVA